MLFKLVEVIDHFVAHFHTESILQNDSCDAEQLQYDFRENTDLNLHGLVDYWSEDYRKDPAIFSLLSEIKTDFVASFLEIPPCSLLRKSQHIIWASFWQHSDSSVGIFISMSFRSFVRDSVIACEWLYNEIIQWYASQLSNANRLCFVVQNHDLSAKVLFRGNGKSKCKIAWPRVQRFQSKKCNERAKETVKSSEKRVEPTLLSASALVRISLYWQSLCSKFTYRIFSYDDSCSGEHWACSGRLMYVCRM